MHQQPSHGDDATAAAQPGSQASQRIPSEPSGRPCPRVEIGTLEVHLGSNVLRLAESCGLVVGRLYLVSGPSGSGKSSFARTMLGLGELTSPRTPCRAEIQLFDARGYEHDVWRSDDYDPVSRAQIAFLPQAERLGFIDSLSTRGNLRLFSRLPAEAADLAISQLAGRFHLARLPDHPARASGGERIRLSAIRGLLPRSIGEGPPALVIADEPTAGLDPQAARALASELLELAKGGESIVVVITHDPQWFVNELPAVDNSPSPGPCVRLIEIDAIDARKAAKQIGRLYLEPRSGDVSAFENWRQKLQAMLAAVGGMVVSPLALVWGILRIKRPWATLKPALWDAIAPGTHLFCLVGCLIVAGTVAYFIFEQTPKPELVEPLLLPEILQATGGALVRVVLPLAACGLVATKLGAAQAARLASAVRAGLLETLALARWPVESFALVPAVLAQVLCMIVATGLALAAGFALAALVYTVGHEGASLPLAMDLMWRGLAQGAQWRTFLATKVLASGFLAGTVSALAGLAPAVSEDDVALAVHRALLWSVLCVIASQCALIVVEFARQ